MPDPWVYPGGIGPGDGTPRVPRAFEEFGTRPSVTRFRALHDSPLGGIALLVDLDAPAPARLEVFDLAGRRVRTLTDGMLPSGATVVPWDGRDDDGAPARRGVYFARLTTRESQRSVRLSYLP